MKSSCTATWVGNTMLALTLAITGAVGCSSGSSPMSGTPPTQPQSTSVLVNMGDSPADGVLECAVTISAMGLTNASGTSVSVPISSPMTIELAHLRGTMAPLVMPSIPQGTYNSASITVSSATVTYMTASSHNPQQVVINTPATVNIPLGTPLVVGSTAMVLNLDLDLAASVGAGSGGGITFTPNFNTSVATASGSATASPEQGGMVGIVGNVTGTSGGSFTMNTLQGMPMTCTTNGATFAGMNGQNMTGIGMMGSGQDVIVNATFQANGTCNANSVTDMMGANGVMPIGIITSVTGSPATSMTIFPDNGIGAGMMASFLANGITINLGGNATYGIDDAGVSMSGAPFPVTFGASNLAVGQNCSMAGSGSMQAPGSGMGGMGGGFMDMGGMSATGIVLEPQGLGGTVVNASSGGFTLGLASDSAFTLLTGASSINVFAASGAQFNGLTAVANGQNVEIYGYLFYNAGAYNFVAMQITLAPGAAA